MRKHLERGLSFFDMRFFSNIWKIPTMQKKLQMKLDNATGPVLPTQ